MDSNDTKQIIIGYRTIKKACGAMLKPIRINLNDTETVQSMTEVQQHTLEYIQAACEDIQNTLGLMEDKIAELKRSVYDDGEIDASVNMISDILFDVPPPATKPFNPHNMADVAKVIGL